MCGIVGYVGDKPALPIVMEKLRMLTYRGYDSAGVAVTENGHFYVAKTKGRVSDLDEILEPQKATGHIGIGHTRWATHGEPSTRNAHPHTDSTGRLVVIHNGIVENFFELKEELIAKGHSFLSDTDTEVVAHLIEEFYDGNIATAVALAMRRMTGSMALLVLHKDEEDRLVAAKMDTPPLIIGFSKGENHVASDIPALLLSTNRIYPLEDGEIATITRDRVIVDSYREPNAARLYDRKIIVVNWSAEVARKDGYEHFMLKEIHEQPDTVQNTLSGRVPESGAGEVKIPELNLTPDEVGRISRLTFVACGTAYYACLVAKYLFEQYLAIPVSVDVGSEYRYRNPILSPNEMMVAISQSGETADTLASMREGIDQGAKVLAITNVLGSSVARLADGVLYTRAGPEIAVASTKAFVGQIAGAHALLQYMAQYRDISADRYERILALRPHLYQVPALIRRILTNTEPIKAMAYRIAEHPAAFYIGRNLDEPLSHEGALKLKELSYIHAQGYAAGELKHGTLALLEEGVPVIALATQPAVYDKMVSNVQEVLARHAWAIAIVPEGDHRLTALLGHENILTVPQTEPSLMPMLTAVVVQLLAYHAAYALQRDIDQPRNLAKSVTVE